MNNLLGALNLILICSSSAFLGYVYCKITEGKDLSKTRKKLRDTENTLDYFLNSSNDALKREYLLHDKFYEIIALKTPRSGKVAHKMADLAQSVFQ